MVSSPRRKNNQFLFKKKKVINPPPTRKRVLGPFPEAPALTCNPLRNALFDHAPLSHPICPPNPPAQPRPAPRTQVRTGRSLAPPPEPATPFLSGSGASRTGVSAGHPLPHRRSLLRALEQGAPDPRASLAHPLSLSQEPPAPRPPPTTLLHHHALGTALLLPHSSASAGSSATSAGTLPSPSQGPPTAPLPFPACVSGGPQGSGLGLLSYLPATGMATGEDISRFLWAPTQPVTLQSPPAALCGFRTPSEMRKRGAEHSRCSPEVTVTHMLGWGWASRKPDSSPGAFGHTTPRLERPPTSAGKSRPP